MSERAAWQRQLEDDLAAGQRRALAAYLPLAPGEEEAVARRWLQGATRAVRDVAPVPGSGRHLGPYEVVRELGAGTQGTVLVARDPRLGRLVAVKVFPQRAGGRAPGQARALREARAIARLAHPALCALLEADLDADPPYLVMQLAAGVSLQEALDAGAGATPDDAAARAARALVAPASPATARAALRFFEQAALALHAAHQQGVVHRDVKPSHLMVTAAGEPVLLDFGMAWVESEATLTRPGEPVGSGSYAPPELQASRTRADRRSDVYSLAAVLADCLCGRCAADAAARRAALRARQAVLPRELQLVLDKALQPAARDRFPTALAFAEELRRIRAFAPIATARTGVMRAVARAVRRNPWPLAAASVLLAVLAAALWLDQRLRRHTLGMREATTRLTALVHATATSAATLDPGSSSLDAKLALLAERRTAHIRWHRGELEAAGQGFAAARARSLDRLGAGHALTLALTIDDAWLRLERGDAPATAALLTALPAPARQDPRARHLMGKLRLLAGDSSGLAAMQAALSAWPSEERWAPLWIEAGLSTAQALLERDRDEEARAVLALLRGAGLPGGHPLALCIAGEEAVLRQRGGEAAHAAVQLSDLASRLAAALGERHPATLRVREALAQSLLAKGQDGVASARATLALVVEDRRRSLGAAHPKTLATEQALARIAESPRPAAGEAPPSTEVRERQEQADRAMAIVHEIEAQRDWARLGDGWRRVFVEGLALAQAKVARARRLGEAHPDYLTELLGLADRQAEVANTYVAAADTCSEALRIAYTFFDDGRTTDPRRRALVAEAELRFFWCYFGRDMAAQPSAVAEQQLERLWQQLRRERGDADELTLLAAKRLGQRLINAQDPAKAARAAAVLEARRSFAPSMDLVDYWDLGCAWLLASRPAEAEAMLQECERRLEQLEEGPDLTFQRGLVVELRARLDAAKRRAARQG